MYTCDVGYIASELCEYLHPLIAAGDILEVYVQYSIIKFWFDFFKIGFYLKFFIKRHGEWVGVHWMVFTIRLDLPDI
jgi:hypothetical protein